MMSLQPDFCGIFYVPLSRYGPMTSPFRRDLHICLYFGVILIWEILRNTANQLLSTSDMVMQDLSSTTRSHLCVSAITRITLPISAWSRLYLRDPRPHARDSVKRLHQQMNSLTCRTATLAPMTARKQFNLSPMPPIHNFVCLCFHNDPNSS